MYALYKLYNTAFTVYMALLVVDLLASWVPEINDSRFIRAVRVLTQPYFSIFRSIIPPIGIIDFSPIVAFGVLQIIQWYVARLLF